jgi:hypothetical protein
MCTFLVNSAIDIVKTLAPLYERTAMSSSTSPRERSTSPVSPKMAADSGYVTDSDNL